MTFVENLTDERAHDNSKPVAKYPLLTTHSSVTNKTTIVGTEKFAFKGVLKQLKYKSPNLTTDGDFTILIKDQDGATVATISSVPDNSPTTPKYHRVTNDAAALLCSGKNGHFTITITWTTSQSLSADVFEIWGMIIDS